MSRSPRQFVPVLGLVGLTVGGFATEASAQTAEKKGYDIAKKMDAAHNGFKGESFDAELILLSAKGDKVSRKMSGRTLEKSGDGDNTILVFTSPADVKGTKVLTWTHKSGTDDQWIFLPSVRRVKRISAQNKTGSFMGSEFSYEDLTGDELEKYKYKFLREEKLGKRDTWVIERYPVDKHSGYKKHVVWVDKEYLAEVQVDLYDRKGTLFKTALFVNYKKLNGLGWRPEKIMIANHQTKKRSTLAFKGHVLGKSFGESEFQPDAMNQ